jgi:hypothetical protein
MRDLQNLDVNLESQSEIISAGMRCSFHISLAKIVARSSGFFIFFFSGMKCGILVNLSISTQSWP